MSMPPLHVLVTDSHEDGQELDDLIAVITSAGFNTRPLSGIHDGQSELGAPETEGFEQNLGWANVVVVLVSNGSTENELLDRAIEGASQGALRIVGVWSKRCLEAEIPATLSLYGNALVRWTPGKITGAILGDNDDWELCDGSLAPPREIVRHGCG